MSQILKGKKALIVEDSPFTRKRLRQLFESLGFLIDTASDGEEGLAQCNKTQYDLIFTDIEMPLLDGISMARKIKSVPKLSHIPILFNSSLSNPVLISDIEKEQLGRYLIKEDLKAIQSEIEAVFYPK